MQVRHFISILVFLGFGNLFSQNDTINQADAYNCKFGYWKIYKEIQEEKVLIEEGVFVNGRKTGIWTEYHRDGQIKNHLQFRDGRPNGFMSLYYENGDTLEC